MTDNSNRVHSYQGGNIAPNTNAVRHVVNSIQSDRLRGSALRPSAKTRTYRTITERVAQTIGYTTNANPTCAGGFMVSSASKSEVTGATGSAQSTNDRLPRRLA